MLVDGIPRLFYRLSRSLNGGEELLVSYGTEHVRMEAVKVVNEQVQLDFLRRLQRFNLGLDTEDPRQTVLLESSLSLVLLLLLISNPDFLPKVASSTLVPSLGSALRSPLLRNSRNSIEAPSSRFRVEGPTPSLPLPSSSFPSLQPPLPSYHHLDTSKLGASIPAEDYIEDLDLDSSSSLRSSFFSSSSDSSSSSSFSSSSSHSEDSSNSAEDSSSEFGPDAEADSNPSPKQPSPQPSSAYSSLPAPPPHDPSLTPFFVADSSFSPFGGYFKCPIEGCSFRTTKDWEDFSLLLAHAEAEHAPQADRFDPLRALGFGCVRCNFIASTTNLGSYLHHWRFVHSLEARALVRLTVSFPSSRGS